MNSHDIKAFIEQASIPNSPSAKKVSDLISTALESGTPWISGIWRISDPSDQEYASDIPLNGGSLLVVIDDEIEDGAGVEYTLDKDAVLAGLNKFLLSDNAAIQQHAKDFLDENDDVITADTFMEIALFGEVIFC